VFVPVSLVVIRSMVLSMGSRLSRVMFVVAMGLVFPAKSVAVVSIVMLPLLSPLMSASLPSSVQLPEPLVVICTVMGGLVPSSNCMSIVVLGSAVPVMRTLSSSAAFIMLSISIGTMVVGIMGAWLSSVIVVFDERLLFPARSVAVTVMLMVPLLRVLMSISLPSSVQFPALSVVIVAVMGGFVPSLKLKSMVTLASAVPVMRTSLSSAALMMLSPSIGVLMVGAVSLTFSTVMARACVSVAVPSDVVTVMS